MIRSMRARFWPAVFTLLITGTTATASVDNLPVGETPPDFTLPRSDGGDVTLSAERGHPVILVFGELYQENTRRALADISDTLDAPGMVAEIRAFVIVSEIRGASALELERANLGISLPVLIDEHRAVFEAYGVTSAIPCTVFIDEAGRLHHAEAGYGLSFVDTAQDEVAFLSGGLTEEELMNRRRSQAPEDAEAARHQRRIRLGNHLHRRGFSSQAREQYQTVLDETPNHPGAHLGLALIELDQSELDLAQSHVQAVLQESPDHTRALKTLVRINLRRGDLDGAEITLQRLTHVVGEDAQTLYLMGRLAEARGEEGPAMRNYRRVSEVLLAEEGW